MFKQTAQKRLEKFGRDSSDRFRKRFFPEKQRKFTERTIKSLNRYSCGEF